MTALANGTTSRGSRRIRTCTFGTCRSRVQDWEQVERLGELEKARGGLTDPDLGWAYFVRGANPQFPVEAFRRDLQLVHRKLARILNEHGDPETWYDAHWLALDPIPTDNLVRLTIGGLPVHKRGEMLHSYIRYFDLDRRQAGLPQGVAALVTGIAADSVTVELVNTNLFERRRLVVQGGAYGEHRIEDVSYRAAVSEWTPGSNPPDASASERRTMRVDGSYFEVDLEPGAGITLMIGLERFALSPSYAFPWDSPNGH